MANGTQLRVVPPIPYGCYPAWRLRDVHMGEVHGDRCMYCAREIATTADARGKNNACLYCCLERGFIPEVEIPPDQKRPHRIEKVIWQ